MTSLFPEFSFLKIALYVVAVTLCLKGVFALGAFGMSRVPSDDDLFSVRGEIRDISLGGDGRATWLKVESDGRVRKYYSYLARVWPGMEYLREGDVVDLTAWSQGRPSRKSSYLWRLAKGEELIVRPEDIREMKERSIARENVFLDRSILFGIALLGIALIRHFSTRRESP